jgi:hypothetical protein
MCKQYTIALLPQMPEHHEEEELYFGEEYYDEDEVSRSDENELENPYEEAARVGRNHTKLML